MSHFSCIGITGDDEAELERVIDQVFERSQPAEELGAFAENHLYFRDPSGAALATHIDGRRKIQCITPFFEAPGGGSRWRVHTTAPQIDRECVHCSGADCDVLDPESGELVTRSAVQWLFFSPWKRWLKEDRAYEIQLSGFASMLALCATDAELEQAQAKVFGGDDSSKPLRLAEKAFLPTGLFGDQTDLGDRARAILTGTVDHIDEPTNTLTQQRFAHLKIRTLCGALDVVAPHDALKGAPNSPTRLLAEVWLVGRPVDVTPPPPPPSLWKKLTGR